MAYGTIPLSAQAMCMELKGLNRFNEILKDALRNSNLSGKTIKIDLVFRGKNRSCILGRGH